MLWLLPQQIHILAGANRDKYARKRNKPVNPESPVRPVYPLNPVNTACRAVMASPLHVGQIADRPSKVQSLAVRTIEAASK